MAVVLLAMGSAPSAAALSAVDPSPYLEMEFHDGLRRTVVLEHEDYYVVSAAESEGAHVRFLRNDAQLRRVELGNGFQLFHSPGNGTFELEFHGKGRMTFTDPWFLSGKTRDAAWLGSLERRRAFIVEANEPLLVCVQANERFDVRATTVDFGTLVSASGVRSWQRWLPPGDSVGYHLVFLTGSHGTSAIVAVGEEQCNGPSAPRQVEPGLLFAYDDGAIVTRLWPEQSALAYAPDRPTEVRPVGINSRTWQWDEAGVRDLRGQPWVGGPGGMKNLLLGFEGAGRAAFVNGAFLADSGGPAFSHTVSHYWQGRLAVAVPPSDRDRLLCMQVPEEFEAQMYDASLRPAGSPRTFDRKGELVLPASEEPSYVFATATADEPANDRYYLTLEKDADDPCRRPWNLFPIPAAFPGLALLAALLLLGLRRRA